MMRAVLPVFLLLAMPAWADGAAQIKGGAPGTNVVMPYVIAPMDDGSGRLTSYAYLLPRLTAASSGDALKVRERLALLQDAFVRDVNRAPVAAARQPARVDIAATEARFLADARQVMGPVPVRQVTICTAEIAGLRFRPDESPPVPAAQGDISPVRSRCAP